MLKNLTCRASAMTAVVIASLCVSCPILGAELTLASEKLRLRWEQSPEGWRLTSVEAARQGGWVFAGVPSGEHTLIHAPTKPPGGAARVFTDNTGKPFPGPEYHYQREQWRHATNAVALNTAGTAEHFFPSGGAATAAGGPIRFTHETDAATVIFTWSIDPDFPGDVVVTQQLTAKKPGYYSLASPALVTVPREQLAWATVPGYFQGDAIQPDFVRAYAYGQGVPELPVVYREKCAGTLAPMVTTKSGLTIAAIPDPALGRDPWENDKNTHDGWSVGISHMSRKAELSPTVYYPALGEPKSQLGPGEQVESSFRFSVIDGDWFRMLNHAVYDVFKLKESLALRRNRAPLMRRIERMHGYLTDPVTSLWRVEDYQGRKIGGQSYLGGVIGSKGDAMKNADYGAMWMLGTSTGDPKITKGVLPFAENFKLAQQHTDDGFFKGAAIGQYYLSKSKKFVEEWGEVVEPIGLTYYTMLDLGNMALFRPDDAALRERLKLGAERLLSWQKPDGSWAVAYDKNTEKEAFLDIPDARPTFYGLIVAYRILKDERYLTGAKRGADWFVANCAAHGHFLGVCGDARYAPDFATAQSAQALLDLFEITDDTRYRDAAITAAKIYCSSIYTHPIPSRKTKTVNGVQREDWEIAQAGLSFEHGGIFGSASKHGPIQLASHAGLFIRMHQLIGEPIFADLARAAAIGREAFVDEKTSVASYYWEQMNRGAGPYPHHAWWQIGWITDYLLAEAAMRSNGDVAFPSGFVTPKVGPHKSYGFAPGRIYGEPAHLLIADGLVQVDDPAVDYVLARGESGKRLLVVLMNSQDKAVPFKLSVAPERFGKGGATRVAGAKRLSPGGEAVTLDGNVVTHVLPSLGLTALAIDLE